MANAPLLEMRNIKKDFFGNQVLTDINLKLEEGEVLGLCGENGAGKSTLMKILFGAADIAATGGYGGEIYLNGEKVSFSSPFDAIEAGGFELKTAHHNLGSNCYSLLVFRKK